MKLKRKFYERPATEAAPELLGKFLVHKSKAGKIVEVEAYMGIGDLASHASKGMTPRTKIMFGKAGIAYVYMIYGMYFCLNVVCQKPETASAVLIRAIELSGCNGPGRLCRTLGISLAHNGVDLTENELYIEDRGILPQEIVRTPRIGVDYAGPWAKKPWRFALKNSKFLSRKL